MTGLGFVKYRQEERYLNLSKEKHMCRCVKAVVIVLQAWLYAQVDCRLDGGGCRDE